MTAVAVQDEDHGVMLDRPGDDPFFLNRMPLAMRQRYIAAYAEQVDTHILSYYTSRRVTLLMYKTIRWN